MLRKAGYLTRDARAQGTQEARSQARPQGTAVHQALKRLLILDSRHLQPHCGAVQVFRIAQITRGVRPHGLALFGLSVR